MQTICKKRLNCLQRKFDNIYKSRNSKTPHRKADREKGPRDKNKEQRPREVKTLPLTKESSKTLPLTKEPSKMPQTKMPQSKSHPQHAMTVPLTKESSKEVLQTKMPQTKMPQSKSHPQHAMTVPQTKLPQSDHNQNLDFQKKDHSEMFKLVEKLEREELQSELEKYQFKNNHCLYHLFKDIASIKCAEFHNLKSISPAFKNESKGKFQIFYEKRLSKIE